MVWAGDVEVNRTRAENVGFHSTCKVAFVLS